MGTSGVKKILQNSLRNFRMSDAWNDLTIYSSRRA